MHLSKLLPAAFLAASLPTAIAEWCIAIGYHNVNMGGGVRLGGTSSTYDRLEIYNENGDEIFEISDDWNEGVCTDLYRVHAADMGLADDFVWAASCKAPGHILECHGSSGAATHIEGEDPEKIDTTFYGIGTSFTRSCAIEFECFPA